MGSVSQFYITFYGVSGETPEYLLSENGFLQGSVRKVLINGEKVGDLTRIRLRMQGNDDYKCNSIRVNIGAKFFDFDCNKVLNCPKDC